jgi:spore coat polysaccharide biosynthesis predicted glycosyltransferase SpsG
MASRAKKLNLFLRFDAGGLDGLGHASRSLELAKKLNKKFTVIICTTKKSIKFTFRNNFKFLLKKENEKEENYLSRISYKYKYPILFIDKNYQYSKEFLNTINKKYKQIFFYQNFSKGIPKRNIIINPTPNLNSSINLRREFKHNKIYSRNKYLIVPKSVLTKKGNYLGISLGGSDPKNISLTLLKFLIKIKWKFSTYLFVGTFFKFKKEINNLNLPKNIKIYKFNKKKFHSSRLAICSPGLTAFELLTQNVFSLYISHTKRHFNLGNYIEKKFKFSKNLNIYNKVRLNYFNKMLNYYWNNEKIIKKKTLNNKLNIFENSCKNVIDVIINEAIKK